MSYRYIEQGYLAYISVMTSEEPSFFYFFETVEVADLNRPSKPCNPEPEYNFQVRTNHPARARSAWACALRVLGLLLADRAPTVLEREDFLTRRPSFFYKNGHNSETKSRKIDPKVGNEPSLQGLISKFGQILAFLAHLVSWPAKIRCEQGRRLYSYLLVGETTC